MLDKPWARNLTISLICLAIVILFFGMRSVLAPVFIALAMAYVFDPLIDRMEKWKISRSMGIVVLCLLFVLALLSLSLYLLPRLLSELDALTSKLPEYGRKLVESINAYLNQENVKQFQLEHAEEIELYKANALSWFQENAGQLASSITSGLASSFKSLGVLMGNLLGLVIIPVLAFYLLRDFNIMTGKLIHLVPLKRREAVEDLVGELHITMSNFIKGQLLVALILSLIYTVGLSIAGCPASLLIGVLAGFANLIPYLGFAIGFVPAVLLTYLSGNPSWQIIVAGLTFVVGQMLEGMVITPKIVGESIGLHPVVVLIGLMIGGTYFGFTGMILALPATAVLMVLLRRTYSLYVNSRLFHDGEPLLTSKRKKPPKQADRRQKTDSDRKH